MNTIIGIDPGLAKTGYGIICKHRDSFECLSYGVFTTASNLSSGERLSLIYDGLKGIIQEYKPDEAGIESLYFARNRSSALPVAQARGVVLLAMFQCGIPSYEYPPQEIKQAIVGNGRADKSQVQELVRLLLGMKDIPQPDHAADALAAAICHTHMKGGYY